MVSNMVVLLRSNTIWDARYIQYGNYMVLIVMEEITVISNGVRTEQSQLLTEHKIKTYFLTSIDLQPKRGNSNSLPSKASLPSLPARGSTDLTSPATKREVKSKNLKSARRSCPQKLQKSRQAWVRCCNLSDFN